MCLQNPNCGEPTAALTVTLPQDVIDRLSTEAADRGVTVDKLVEEPFSSLRNRICPAYVGG